MTSAAREIQRTDIHTTEHIAAEWTAMTDNDDDEYTCVCALNIGRSCGLMLLLLLLTVSLSESHHAEVCAASTLAETHHSQFLSFAKTHDAEAPLRPLRPLLAVGGSILHQTVAFAESHHAQIGTAEAQHARRTARPAETHQAEILVALFAETQHAGRLLLLWLERGFLGIHRCHQQNGEHSRRLDHTG